jgi:hypothetical protein
MTAIRLPESASTPDCSMLPISIYSNSPNFSWDLLSDLFMGTRKKSTRPKMPGGWIKHPD